MRCISYVCWNQYKNDCLLPCLSLYFPVFFFNLPLRDSLYLYFIFRFFVLPSRRLFPSLHALPVLTLIPQFPSPSRPPCLFLHNLPSSPSAFWLTFFFPYPFLLTRSLLHFLLRQLHHHPYSPHPLPLLSTSLLPLLLFPSCAHYSTPPSCTPPASFLEVLFSNRIKLAHSGQTHAHASTPAVVPEAAPQPERTRELRA